VVDPNADPIEVVDSRYDEWRERFAAERDRVRGTLAERGRAERVHRIEHVGSTALPGLAADDIVDLDVVVDDDAVPAVSRAIETELGGSRSENSGAWHPVFREHDGQRFNVHVFAASGEKWKVSVATRDVLSARPELRAEYERVKRDLAADHDDLTIYSRGKTEMVAHLLRVAREADDLAFDFTVPEAP
jgi:GrpB-like predicted nucleotidyltransferase (UPF0157 family)